MTKIRDFVEAGQGMAKMTTAMFAPPTGKSGVWLFERGAGLLLSGMRLATRLGLPETDREVDAKLSLPAYRGF